MPKSIQLRTVNKRLAELGVKERLFKGEGYYYFSEGDTPNWPATSVYVCTLNALTLEQYLDEWKSLSGNTKFPAEEKTS